MGKSLSASLRVATIYAVFAGAWILFSDMAVEAMVADARLLTQIQTFKGWFFVTVTAALLFFLVLGNNRKVERVFQLDGLTGLLNHHMVKNQLDRRLATLQDGQKLIVGYLDVDNFKSLNQTLGFDRADDFILQLAAAIERFAMKDAIIGCLPPDQFIVAREYTAGEVIDSRVRAYQALFKKVAQQFNIDASCSIGVALYPDDGKNAKGLMNSAVEALNIAKQRGNAVQYHDKSLTQRAEKRRQMLQELRKAIDEQTLSLVYQPKYQIDNLALSGLEVLLRWEHPQEGFISPATFIPLAEEYGLSHDISRFVVNRAAEELGASGLLGQPIKHVAINVSAAEFNQESTMDDLLAWIKQFPQLAAYLRIEITETATLTDMAQSSAIINKMRKEGLGFSIDDFGTGYTSLAMLKDFTIDEIKIDRSFVSAIEQDDRSKTIVGSIIAMAKNFSINVVAEGVETASQLDVLLAMGCKEAQGFYLGRPMTLSALQEHVKSPALNPV